MRKLFRTARYSITFLLCVSFILLPPVYAAVFAPVVAMGSQAATVVATTVSVASAATLAYATNLGQRLKQLLVFRRMADVQANTVAAGKPQLAPPVTSQQPWATLKPVPAGPEPMSLPPSQFASPNIPAVPGHADMRAQVDRLAAQENRAWAIDTRLQKLNPKFNEHSLNVLQKVAGTSPEKEASLWQVVKARLDLMDLHIQDPSSLEKGMREQLLNNAQEKLKGCYFDGQGTLKHPGLFSHNCPMAAIGELFENFPKSGKYNWKEALNRSGMNGHRDYITRAEGWGKSRLEVCQNCTQNKSVPEKLIRENTLNAAYKGVVRAWETNDPSCIVFPPDCLNDRLFSDLINEYANNNPYCAADPVRSSARQIIERAVLKKNLEAYLGITAENINALNPLNYQLLDFKGTPGQELSLIHNFVEAHPHIPNIRSIYFDANGLSKLMPVDAATRSAVKEFSLVKLLPQQRLALNKFALGRTEFSAEQLVMDHAIADLQGAVKGVPGSGLFSNVVERSFGIGAQGVAIRQLLGNHLRDVSAPGTSELYKQAMHQALMDGLHTFDDAQLIHNLKQLSPSNALMQSARQLMAHESLSKIGQNIVTIATTPELCSQFPLSIKELSKLSDFSVIPSHGAQSLAIHNDTVTALHAAIEQIITAPIGIPNQPLAEMDAGIAKALASIKQAQELNLQDKADQAVATLYPTLCNLGIKPTAKVPWSIKLKYLWSQISNMDPQSKQAFGKIGLGAFSGVATAVSPFMRPGMAVNGPEISPEVHDEVEGGVAAAAGGNPEDPNDPNRNRRNNRNDDDYSDLSSAQLQAMFEARCQRPGVLQMRIGNGRMTVAEARAILQRAEALFKNVPGYNGVLHDALVEILRNIAGKTDSLGVLFEFETGFAVVAQGDVVSLFRMYGFDVITRAGRAIECKNVRWADVPAKRLLDYRGKFGTQILNANDKGLRYFLASGQPIPTNLPNVTQQNNINGLINYLFSNGGQLF